ncbi:hypothetical protein BCR44DRAFT_1510245, partial [Catenaria anguillulae PL171]
MTQPALAIAPTSLSTEPQLLNHHTNPESLSAFDFPVVPGLTDGGDSDEPSDLYGVSGTAFEPELAPIKPTKYYARKRKSAEAQSPAPQMRQSPSFATSSTHGFNVDRTPNASDTEAVEPLLAKRPRLQAMHPARRSVIRSPEQDSFLAAPMSSTFMPPLPPLQDFPSDSGTDTDPDIPKVFGLAAFNVPPPPLVRPQLTPPPA